MTSIKQLLNWWNEEFPDWEKSSEGYKIIEKAVELMEKEKQQIIDAFDNGRDFTLNENGKHYFESVYEQ